MSSAFQTETRIFPCASCGEMIYSDSTTCRFCKAPVDHERAQAAADVQKNVNNAVNMAKWIRNLAGAMWAFVLLGLFLGVLMLAAMVCIVLIPAALITWQIRYGNLKTADADFEKTKRDRLAATLLWVGASILQLLILIAQAI